MAYETLRHAVDLGAVAFALLGSCIAVVLITYAAIDTGMGIVLRIATLLGADRHARANVLSNEVLLFAALVVACFHGLLANGPLWWMYDSSLLVSILESAVAIVAIEAGWLAALLAGYFFGVGLFEAMHSFNGWLAGMGSGREVERPPAYDEANNQREG